MLMYQAALNFVIVEAIFGAAFFVWYNLKSKREQRDAKRARLNASRRRSLRAYQFNNMNAAERMRAYHNR